MSARTALLALLLAFAAAAAAGDFPSRAVKLVVGATPGSGPDVASRILADGLRDALGQPVVVENRPGADAIIAARTVVNAAADGYTLLQATNGQITVTPVLHGNLPFDVERDLTPVAAIARWPLALVVPASRPFHSIGDMLAYAKANPGELTYASASSNYLLALDTFQELTRTELRHIPYPGIPAAVHAVAAGEADVAIVNAVAAMGAIKAGKLRALAVNSDERLPALPDVPTFAQAGVPGFDFGIWLGMYAPAGVPPRALARLHEAVTHALTHREVRAKLAALGMTPLSATPGEVRAMLERDRAAYTARARQLRDGGQAK